MKEIVFIIFTLFNLYCFSQEPYAALEAPELNVLYRGYNNIIEPAVTNNSGFEVQLVGSPNVTITKYSEYKYSVVPNGKGREVILTVQLVKGDSIRQIKNVAYRVSNLPYPTLYWGGAKESERASIKEKRLFAKYGPEIPLKAQFTVTSWAIINENDSITGKGSNISTAESFLSKIEVSTKLKIVTTVMGPDGVSRIIKGEWKVLPWKEDKGSEIIVQPGG